MFLGHKIPRWARFRTVKLVQSGCKIIVDIRPSWEISERFAMFFYQSSHPEPWTFSTDIDLRVKFGTRADRQKNIEIFTVGGERNVCSTSKTVRKSYVHIMILEFAKDQFLPTPCYQSYTAFFLIRKQRFILGYHSYFDPQPYPYSSPFSNGRIRPKLP